MTHDPTHGRIDRDIQQAVDEWGPASLGQRVAVENTLQRRRDDGLVVLGVEPARLGTVADDDETKYMTVGDDGFDPDEPTCVVQLP